MLVDFAVALPPVVIFSGLNAQPSYELTSGSFVIRTPEIDEFDDRILGIVGNPLQV